MKNTNKQIKTIKHSIPVEPGIYLYVYNFDVANSTIEFSLSDNPNQIRCSKFSKEGIFVVFDNVKIPNVYFSKFI